MSKPRTGAPKRVAVGLLAGALAMFGVALAPPAGATTTVTTERLSGATRYGTAAAIAGNSAFATPTTAIVATGENFPDALAASSLAGANAPAPIILTQTNTYTQEAKAGLAALKAKGVTALTIVGGTAAVSEDVESAIKGDGFTVARVAGDDRYETAAAIGAAADAKRAQTVPAGGLKTALIATGLNFPDALAGGPIAYANRLPLLLVNDTVPTDTANAISTLGIKKVIILGGTAAVSQAVEAQLIQATGNPATRLAGVNRYSTAVAIGEYEIGTLGFAATSAILATGENFPDALAAGPLGGQLRAPIVLTTGGALSSEAQAFLDKYSPRIAKIWVAGGTEAISDATVAAAKTAAQNTSNDVPSNATVTSRPELTAAAVRGTVTTGILAGTTVRYTFDEAVNVATAGIGALFHVVAGSGTRYDGDSISAVSGDPNSVDVVFTDAALQTAAGASALTVATTDNGAINDLTGEGTPEGDAQLGSTGTTSNPLAAGTTTAPDLTAVQNFRLATSTLSFVDFVFDQPATNVTSTGYHLIALDGTTDVVCTYDSGSATATITAVCGNTTTGVALAPASYARGTVDANTVRNATATAVNPLEAADISNGGNTGTPDLVSATIDFNGTGNDLINLVFDQAVATFGALTAFQIYNADGTEANPTNYATSAGTPNNVQLVFADQGLANAVGVSIDDDAVSAVGGSNPGSRNQQDEVGVANSTTTSTTAGKTNTPDLISVKKAAATDIFGTPTGGYTFTFTFDQDVATAPGNFFIYLADGTRTQLGGCVALTIGNGGTEDSDSSVRCSTYTGLTNTAANTAVLGTVDNGAVTQETTLTPSAAEGAEVIS